MSISAANAGASADPVATFTVLSAYSGNVYACCVTADQAAGWMKAYSGIREDLLALALRETWRSYPDARGIAVMRMS
jgi:hypothetical protein